MQSLFSDRSNRHKFDRSNKKGHRLTHCRINPKSGTRSDTQPDSVAFDMTRVVSWLRNINDDGSFLYPSKSQNF